MKLKITYTNFNVLVPRLVAKVYKVTPFGLPDGMLASIFTAKGQLLSASASATPAIIPAPASDGLSPISDSSQTSGWKLGTPTVEVEDTKNHLLNGGFDFAQRLAAPGTDTTIADEKYSADRWRITRENADLQFSRQDASSESGLSSMYYGKYTKITNAGKFAIYQPLEFRDSLPLRGRDIVFQVQMKASAAKTVKIALVELEAAGTADTLPAAFVNAWNVDSTDPTLGSNLAVIGSVGSCSVTTSWQNFSVTGTVPDDSKNIMVAIWTDADFSAADWLGVAEAGLYRGASTQAWAPPHISDELARCQRYYYLHAQGNDLHLSVGTGYATGSAWGTVRFPVTMRTTPTLDATTGSNYYVFRRAGASDAFDTLAISGAHPNAAMIYADGGVTHTAGDNGDIRTNSASARVGFAAEL